MKQDKTNTFNPASCISAKVMRISRLTAGIFRKYLQPFNITDSQVSILFLLVKKGGLSQKEICAFTKLEKSSLNRNLKRLFDRGFLSREDFPIIRPTAEGARFVEEILPEWEKAMAEIRELLGEEGEGAIDIVLNKLTTKK